MPKWAHEQILAFKNGFGKVYCRCGWQSPKVTRDEAYGEQNSHRIACGLRERREGARPSSD